MKITTRKLLKESLWGLEAVLLSWLIAGPFAFYILKIPMYKIETMTFFIPLIVAITTVIIIMDRNDLFNKFSNLKEE